VTALQAVPARRVWDIEEALRWCYRDEMPKRSANDGSGASEPSSVSPMFRWCAFGGRVDNWTREPGFPTVLGPPHADALLIHGVVEALTVEDILPRIQDYAHRYGCNPPGIDVEILAEQAAGQVVALVQTRARLGARPDHGPDPEVLPVRSENGGKITVYYEEEGSVTARDGTVYPGLKREVPVPDAKKRAGADPYFPTGSYVKLKYLPGRIATYTERAEYATWHAALVLLADRLDHLTSIEARYPNAARRPWAGDRDLNRTGVVLRDCLPPHLTPQPSGRRARLVGARVLA
jgi:hypothetical protein